MVRGRFVGRVRELGVLAERVHAASGGDAQVVLVAGEPGVGKSRLAEEVAGHASGLGMTCEWGRAAREEGSPPYWVFQQVVRGLSGAGPEFETGVAGDRERFRLFDSVTEFLASAAEPNGLLVVLDDLQWVDPASLRLLVYLATSVRKARLVVLGCYRDTEIGDRLQAALAELAGEPVVTRLRLAGLAEPEVAAQLAGITGWPVPESVSAAMWRRSRGNPFFVGELGRLLVDASEGLPEELPVGVRDAVRGRLARLSIACRAVVSAAAVLGSEVDVAGRAAGGRPADVAAQLQAVDEHAVGVFEHGEV